jgi:hypothetical protein
LLSLLQKPQKRKKTKLTKECLVIFFPQVCTRIAFFALATQQIIIASAQNNSRKRKAEPFVPESFEDIEREIARLNEENAILQETLDEDTSIEWKTDFGAKMFADIQLADFNATECSFSPQYVCDEDQPSLNLRAKRTWKPIPPMSSHRAAAEVCDFSSFSTDSIVMSLQEFAATLDVPAAPVAAPSTPEYMLPTELEEFIEYASSVIEAAKPEQFAGVHLQIGGFLKPVLMAKNLPTSGRRIMCASFDGGRPPAATFLHGQAALKWLARPAGHVELASIRDVILVLASGGKLFDTLRTFSKVEGTIFLPTVTTDSYLSEQINSTFTSMLRLDRSKTNLGVDIDDFNGNVDDLLMSFLELTKLD